MAQSRHFRWRLASALAVAAVVGLLITIPSPASAEEPRPGRAPAEAAAPAAPDGDAGITAIVPGTHRCTVIGWGGGYHGVHCATIDLFTNSGGNPAIRARGQTYCQRDSDNQVVPCQGASHIVEIFNVSFPADYELSLRACGTYGGSACPSGRLSTLSPGVYRWCNETYYAIVSSSIRLPSGWVVSQDSFLSNAYTPTSSCM